ncbi:PilZ domain-containing protein [Desulfosediminicola flagellatus]|uniref:PilZ domain-containing protein n=1 Tax=Desulfosediminicola flagellatus TaxID=2569541 RepID=UPI0010ABC49B|nr:PilZ domain-containing protein [Desulfosediminicola flagellatus]
MADQESAVDYDKLLKQLKGFFPGEGLNIESVKYDMNSRKLFIKPEDFLPYLQTALLDEKLIEVRFDYNDNPHFTRIIDWPAKEKENASDEVRAASAPGAYFQDMTHITSLPMEPSIGNYHIKKSQSVVMRFFTKSFAVELCTTFLRTNKYENLPVLQFQFPVIGRLLKGEREYRAKVTKGFDLKVHITGKRKQPDIMTDIINVSATGLAFSLEKKDVNNFLENETRKLKVIKDGEELFKVNAKVRHVSRIRKRTSIAYFCGVELDLVTQSMTREVETLLATVQRAHLQALSGLSRETGYNLIS